MSRLFQIQKIRKLRPKPIWEDYIDDAFDINTNAEELHRYIDYDVQHTNSINDFDILKWWSDHKVIFPNLFNIFLRYACIPATSASSERVSSITGLLISERRSKLLPDTVNNIILARNNYIS